MLYAVKNGYEYESYPQAEGFLCPECYSDVIPVCGSIYDWHWRHAADKGCKYGSGQTKWHRDMIRNFPTDPGRHRVDKGSVIHDYDVLLPGGTAVEMQHSAISSYDIVSRNNLVDKIVWLFDMSEQYERGQITVTRPDLFIYNRPKDVVITVCPNVHYYLKPGLIIFPHSMTNKKISNYKSGQYEWTLSGRFEWFTEGWFVHRIMEFDRNYGTKYL